MPHLQLCVRIPMLTFPGFCHGPTFWEHEAQWCSTLLPVVWVSPVGWGRCEGVNIGQEAWGEGGKRERRVMEMGILGSGWWKTYGCFTQHFLALLNSNVLKFLKLTIYDNLLNLISKLLNIHNEDFLGHVLESSFLFPTLGDHFLRQDVAPCWGFQASSWWPWVLSRGVSTIGAGSSYSTRRERRTSNSQPLHSETRDAGSFPVQQHRELSWWCYDLSGSHRRRNPAKCL